MLADVEDGQGVTAECGTIGQIVDYDQVVAVFVERFHFNRDLNCNV